MTRKELLKKLAPMAIALVVLITVALVTSLATGNDKTANVTDPEGIFATLESMEVTNEEVYERLINQFGAKELRQYIDYELLANGDTNYVEMAMNDADFIIGEYIERAMYNGYLYEQALNIYTEEQLAELEASFDERLVYNGYKSLDEYKDELYLEHARGLYTKDQLIAEDTILVSDLVLEFEANYYDDAVVVGIRVDTLDEARKLLFDEGIVTDETGKFLEEYSNQDILAAYVNIYNKVYANRDELTLGEALAGTNEDIQVNFDEMSVDQPELAEFIFRLLDTRNTVDAYTGVEYKTYTEPIEINTGAAGYYMAYKVSGDDQNAMPELLNGISEEEYVVISDQPASTLDSTDLIDELLNDVLYSKSNTLEVIQNQLLELYEEHEFTIYDQYLKYNFDMTYGVTPESDESSDYTFSYIDNSNNLVEVTPDEFFTIMEDHVAPIVMNLFNTKLATTDETLIAEVVTDELKDEVLLEIDNYKVNFQQDVYASYGLSPTVMNWDEFIYAAFQYRTELDLYNSMLEASVVEKYRINMYTDEDIQEVYYDLMFEEYENAFELDVKHFLVYLDQDEDGNPDLNEKMWTEEQILLANELLDLLRDKVTDLNDSEEITLETLTEIESEYKTSSFNVDETAENYSEWAKYKTFGLKVKVEDLSTVSNGAMVPSFENELKVMYDAMVEDGLFNIISDNNISTQYGYHLIYSDKYYEKGDAYPDDEKVFPSRLDIQAFNDEEFDNISTETLIFIAKYYTPVTNEYTENYQLVLFDEARAEVGTISFTNSKYAPMYDELVAINLVAAERNE